LASCDTGLIAHTEWLPGQKAVDISAAVRHVMQTQANTAAAAAAGSVTATGLPTVFVEYVATDNVTTYGQTVMQVLYAQELVASGALGPEAADRRVRHGEDRFHVHRRISTKMSKKNPNFAAANKDLSRAFDPAYDLAVLPATASLPSATIAMYSTEQELNAALDLWLHTWAEKDPKLINRSVPQASLLQLLRNLL